MLMPLITYIDLKKICIYDIKYTKNALINNVVIVNEYHQLFLQFYIIY